jgi:hypothetical protein
MYRQCRSLDRLNSTFQVSHKRQETERLQHEVEEARQRQQEASDALVRATTETMRHHGMANAGQVYEHAHNDDSEESYANGDDMRKSSCRFNDAG